MNMLNMAGLITVSAAALWCLWGVAARVERGRHRRIDADDAHVLAALRARWNPGDRGRHALVQRPESSSTDYLPPLRVIPALAPVPERLRLEGHSAPLALPSSRHGDPDAWSPISW
jgi:hypothetical protein